LLTLAKLRLSRYHGSNTAILKRITKAFAGSQGRQIATDAEYKGVRLIAALRIGFKKALNSSIHSIVVNFDEGELIL
jgi:hypothetical protein